MQFYVGLHHPCHAKQFERCCISVNVLRRRKFRVEAGDVLLDSGAFTEISNHGGYRNSVEVYADEIRRLINVVPIIAAVAQDYMCEPFIVERTGLSIAEHQRLTIERYDALVAFELPVPIMPVLQGYQPADYSRHIDLYGDRLSLGAWVGVGSVCKRNSSPLDVAHVLAAIHNRRPDLRLHGFGVKRTAILEPVVQALLYSADSMAWSFAARKQGRNQNDWREAKSFEDQVVRSAGRAQQPWQMSLGEL